VYYIDNTNIPAKSRFCPIRKTILSCPFSYVVTANTALPIQTSAEKKAVTKQVETPLLATVVSVRKTPHQFGKWR
jgi:hypothetical protein